jgi:EmrB/QacA subfamily drug resistance transporter
MNNDISIHTLTPPPTGFRKWAPLIVLSFALLIIVLDTTILNVSLRTIIGDLHTTIQKIQWVITAYSLTLAAFTITGGRLGDLFGRKRMFIVGAIIFAVGSFITSISHSVGVMIAGEAIIEGIGAALMMPATSSLLVANYKGRDRQLAFGVWGGIAAAAAALGPVFGGWLTTFYSWRWAFRINVLVAVILVIAARVISESRDTAEKDELDFMGVLLSSSALFLIVFGFIETSTHGWGSGMVIFSLICGFGLLLDFILWELYRERTGHTPLVSMKLFKNTQFTVGASVTGILMLGYAGMSFAVPIFLQAVKNLDAFHTGITMLPMSLALLVAAPSSAYISKYIAPKRIIQAGLVIVAIGFVVLSMGIQTDLSVWALTPGFIIFGIGMGFMISQTSNMTLSAVSVEQAGEASGVNGTIRTVGSTLGSAILGAILLSTLAANLVSGVQGSSVISDDLKPSIVEVVRTQTSNIEFGSGAQTVANTPPEVTEEIKSITAEATVDASHTTLWWGIGFIMIAFFLSFKLPNGKNVEVAEDAKPLAVGH